MMSKKPHKFSRLLLFCILLLMVVIAAHDGRYSPVLADNFQVYTLPDNHPLPVFCSGGNLTIQPIANNRMNAICQAIQNSTMPTAENVDQLVPFILTPGDTAGFRCNAGDLIITPDTVSAVYIQCPDGGTQ